jgi:hypothetical protein
LAKIKLQVHYLNLLIKIQNLEPIIRMGIFLMSNYQESASSYHLAQAKIITAVWKDESLREELRRHPKETLEKIFGHKLEPGMNVRMVECADNEVCFMMPPTAEATSKELSEEQLDAVAGGVDFFDRLGYGFRTGDWNRAFGPPVNWR